MTYYISSSKIFALLLYFAISCTPSTDKSPESITPPEFKKTDSLTIHHKGDLQLLNWTQGMEYFVLYESEEKRVLLADRQGEILQKKSLSNTDTAGSLPSKFYSIHFLDENQLLMVGATHLYWLNDSLQGIKEKDIPINQFSLYFNPGHLNLLHQNHLFTFGYPKHVMDWQKDAPDFYSRYPFLWVYDMEEDDFVAQAELPFTIKQRQAQGHFLDIAPYAQIQEDKLYLLFPHSPYIFSYSFPALELEDSLKLEPGKDFTAWEPIPKDELAPGLAYERMITSSAWIGFHISGDRILASYRMAASQNAYYSYLHDPSPEGFKEFIGTHKGALSLIYEKDEKRWEGKLDPIFEFRNGLIIRREKAKMQPTTTFYFLSLATFTE
ncbi:hypothetical protein [Pleomorphovibrio marinus]|uniref:hypothetical protein n=1 Tax=Pleomorphovibrio marinus TaxID=2164132 RepID=UPI000E0BC3ED|nr:hypothetical protein [Pleomorphovibrio marinus]